ncbi:sigma-54 interaction domain-containing protein [Marinococcus halophilus]|uniref:sigma-54 interaction domain-containing protein n=1 Tax=Marinococcus halophilus TaxID=1371 RepID=UPI0009A75F7C|nr:sigma 54-interacting transcriptional regulator [Marinococcus halophilus]
MVEHEMYEKLMEEVDIGVHAVDVNGNTVIYNTKMASIESMDKEEVINRSIDQVFKFKSGEPSTLERALQEGAEFKNIKQTYLNNKGNEITSVNHTFPVWKRDTIIGAVELAKDVTMLEKLIQENMDRAQRSYSFEDVIGQSTEIKEIIEYAKRATRTSSSVLIIGETGTGKEIFAQSIHNGSDRSSKPFISQNCAALPDSLIESILFGTKKGAFTGSADRPGLFEQAEGGTLLLDEINSLSMHLQSKLLRVLQERSVRRIGDTRDISVDVRIIATSNEDPIEAITNQRLRKDLYYRLGVVSLFIPPLKDRKDDIKMLSDYFIRKYNALFRMNIEKVDENVMQFFMNYEWPGNVRELEHLIEGAMNITDHETAIRASHLPMHIHKRIKAASSGSKSTAPDFHQEGPAEEEEPAASTGQMGLHDFLYYQEKQFILKVLEENNYHVKDSAAQLGLSRQSLHYRLNKLNIQKLRL